MTYKPGNYPLIDRLLAAIEYFDIHIELRPSTTELDDMSFCNLQFTADEKSFDICVDDEFGDAEDESNQALLLHLVLREGETYRDSEDFLDWCGIHGLDVASALALEIYKDLGNAIPFIHEMLGDKVTAVPEFDYQLGAGDTEMLRSLSKQED